MSFFFKHRPRWGSYIFVLLSVVVLSVSIGKGQGWNPIERVVVEITAPLKKYFVETVIAARGLWKNYFLLVETHQENLLLKKKMALLEIENSRYQELLMANERLLKLLKFKENTDEPLLPARVIGWDPTGLFQSVTIDKGQSDGLQVNMPVVNSQGVAGRSVSVSPHYAQVLLITDQNSAVDGLVQRTRERGMLKGTGSSECYFDYVIKSGGLRKGDAIVTSGLGGIFPKGLYLGVIKSIHVSPNKLFKDVRVAPAVDFSMLEEVLVILRSGFVPLTRPGIE